MRVRVSVKVSGAQPGSAVDLVRVRVRVRSKTGSGLRLGLS